MRVLICGGRTFTDWVLLGDTLDKFHAQTPFSVVIHGVARGADTLGAEWAEARGIPVEGFRADWKKYGKAAGAIRNTRMLKEGKPDLVIAFPGRNGTRDMIEQARAADVKVEVIE